MRTPARLVAVAISTLLLTLAASPPAGARGTRYFRDTTHRYKVEPDVIYLGARALFPPFKLTKLQPWRAWGHAHARARGVLHYDDCKPDCASGTYRKTRARVRLGGIHECHHRRVYGKIRIKPRDKPAHRHRVDCQGYIT